MIVVTHEMVFARAVATNVVFLHEGRIADQGNPENMFNISETEVFRNFISDIR